uniref:Rho_N domain-containing protein n=1 Tax=Panagrellus redivivus TaxID=6233 RepID=A0A7E4VSG2_PANRE
MAKTRSMPASPGTPLTLEAALKKTPRKGAATPKKPSHTDTPRPPKPAAKAVEETKDTPAKAKASPKPAKVAATPKPAKTPATPKNAKPAATPKPAKPAATPKQTKTVVTPKATPAEPAPTPKQTKATPKPAKVVATPKPTKAAATPKTAKTVATPKATPAKPAPTPKQTKATPKPTKAAATPKPAKATPKPKLPVIEAAKKAETAVESPVLKNTKASKLANLFKSAKGKKDAAEIKKLTEELGLSSDEFDDSDADIFDESDDGLVYAQDASDEEEEGGIAVINADDDEDIADSEEEADESKEEVVAKPAKKTTPTAVITKTGNTPEPKTTTTEIVKRARRRKAKAVYPVVEDGVLKSAKVGENGEIEIIGVGMKLNFDKKTNNIKREIDATGGIALKALTAYQSDAQKDKKKLFEEEGNAVYLDVKYKLPGFIPTTQRVGSRKLYELTFPEKTPENASVCLILPDLSHTEADVKDHDYEKQARLWGDILREKFNLTGKDVSKIYTMTQLRREIHTRADKNKFARTYDIFLVDRSIYTLVIYHIGRDFQKGSRQPYPLIITANNVPQQIKRAYGLASMDVRPGTCHVSLKIGNLTQGASKLAVNLRSATECLFKNIPGGWKNLKTASIALDEFTIQLPIYVDFSPKSEVEMVKPEPAPRNIVEDELNTLDSKYRVRIDNGEIKVVDAKTGQVVGDPKAYFGDALEDVEDDGVAVVDEEEETFKAAPLVVKTGEAAVEDGAVKPKKAGAENVKPKKANKKRKHASKSAGPPSKKAVKA